MTRAAVKSFIVCDDMRLENSGKGIFIGVYADTIVFHQPFPVSYPKLNFVLRVDSSRVSGATLTLRLTGPKREKIFSADMSVSVPQTDSDTMLTFTWNNPAFKVEGIYNISFLINGKKSFSDHIKVKTTKP
ncbi:MAG: hypothetical protein MN733_19640 [Nitrososphaera sp.]|nr:hypothetical protein [Nitrososphaera sp.]